MTELAAGLSIVPGGPIEQVSDATSVVAGRIFPNKIVFRYDTVRFGVRRLVENFFGTADLEHLHETPWFEGPGTPKKRSLAVGREARAAIAEPAAVMLRDLIYEHIATFIGPIISHQTDAMLRVNFAGSRAVLRFHRDSEYGEQPNQMNVWIPITRVFGSNSMYLESTKFASDFTPVTLDYGQAIIFRGYDLLHGNLDNRSGSTRISYDLRFAI